MKTPTENDFGSHEDVDPIFKENLFKASLEVKACPAVTDPGTYIKVLVNSIILREKLIGNPDPEFSNHWTEPKDHLTLLNDRLLKNIKDESIDQSFNANIKLFDCDNEELIKVAKKYKSIKFFYNWLEAFKIIEEAIFADVLNGNVKLREEGIDHLDVYFKIGKIELKIVAQRFHENALQGHKYQLNIGIEDAFWGMHQNLNTVAFSKV